MPFGVPVSCMARGLAFLTSALMALIVIGCGYVLYDIDVGRDLILSEAPALDTPVTLGDGTLRLMMVFGLISVAVQLYALWQARALFHLYGSGDYLSLDCADAITRLGVALISLPLLKFLLEPIWSIIMTLGQEEQQVSIGISSSGIGFLIGGFLVLLIGWSMCEAAALAEENRSFV